jgi:hypothetical protein
MPVRYIEVNPISRLFVPATRAYGDIAIVGKGSDATTMIAVNTPQMFTNPDDAAAPFGHAITPTPKVSDVYQAIAMAFSQTPGPSRVWGVRVDSQTPDWAGALSEVAKLNVQIVVLANTAHTSGNATALSALETHVTTVSNTGGDGKERIGVAMLQRDATVATSPSLIASDRMFYVAHRAENVSLTQTVNTPADVAAAAAGVIAGYEPHISMVLKPIAVRMLKTFTEAEIDAFDTAGINWLTDPVLIPGSDIYLGEGYTGRIGGPKKYIDIVRTLDSVSFALKAVLIRAIGDLRMTRAGLRAVVTLIENVLSPLQAREVIEAFQVHIPLLVLLDRDPASLTLAELQEIDAAQAARKADIAVTVDYAGAIHRMRINLVFK